MQNSEQPGKPQIFASRRDQASVRIERARALRQTATEAGTRAWYLLRKLRLKGFKFRRQHPIGSYVVDFCCAERRLVIELDGSIHAQPSQIRKDRIRDQQLKRLGYIVARYPNGIVLEAPDVFVEKVLGRAFPLPNVFTGER